MKQLLEDIKTGQFRQAYLLYGQEAYLRNQYRDRLKAAMVQEGDTMNFSLSGFYDYEWQRSENGVESVNTDKYGASGNYKWHFLGADSNWYFTVVAAYRHDTLKMINYQI